MAAHWSTAGGRNLSLDRSRKQGSPSRRTRTRTVFVEIFRNRAQLEHALPDPAVRDYLHRIAGSFLEGVAQHDILPTIHGPTGTAKSTVVRAIAAALGTRSHTSDRASGS